MSRIYRPLDPDKAEIRVFRLEHLALDATISLHLSKLSFRRHAKYYSALSYCWGDAQDKETIIVDGHQLQIPRNLADAIRNISNSLTPHKDSIVVWADAICINQDDVGERNHQVQMMQDIYRCARRTVSWLGCGSPDEVEAWDLIKRVSDKIREQTDEELGLPGIEVLLHFPELAQSQKEHWWAEDAPRVPNALWEKIEGIWGNPYWRRVWIIQEVALNEEVLLYLGNSIMGWHHFLRFHAWLNVIREEDASPDLGPLVFHDSDVSDAVRSYIVSEALQCYFNIQSIGWLKFRLDNGDPLSMDRMTNYLQFSATDPRDKVYALLGIFKLDITVDYSRSNQDVFLDLAREWLRQLGNLEFLAYAGRGFLPQPGALTSLPTWIPCWLPGQGGDSKRAKGSLPSSEILVRVAPRIHLATLTFNGYKFDLVQKVHGDTQRHHGYENVQNADEQATGLKSGAAPSRVEKYKKWKAEGALEFPGGMPFLRALFSVYTESFRDEANELLQPGSAWFYRLTCAFLKYLVFHQEDYCNEADKPISDWITTGLAESGMTNDPSFCDTLKQEFLGSIPVPEEWLGKTCEEVFALQTVHLYQDYCMLLRHIDAIMSFKTLFETEKGYMGSGSVWMQESDVVMLVPGLSCPLILRQQDTQYVHVGPCYIAGIEPQQHILDNTDWRPLECIQLK